VVGNRKCKFDGEMAKLAAEGQWKGGLEEVEAVRVAI
jgi:hypothetical protein